MALSKQQQKSNATKAKIFDAARQILKRDGYERLSIKNICEEAGVSNGSFYHHFNTKDDLLSYYIEALPVLNPDLFDVPDSRQEIKEAIVQVYLNYADFCREMGVDFMANYYTPKNQSLNPLIRTERRYPITTVRSYLQKCILAGLLPDSLDLEAVTTDVRMIVIGNVFEWSMKNGDCDFKNNMARSLTTYLDGLF